MSNDPAAAMWGSVSLLCLLIVITVVAVYFGRWGLTRVGLFSGNVDAAKKILTEFE